jgi:hypothetical protein
MPVGCARVVRRSRTEQRMLALLNFIDYLQKVRSDQFGKTRTPSSNMFRLNDERTGVRIPKRARYFLFYKAFGQALGPTQTRGGGLLVEEGRKRSGREVDHEVRHAPHS